MNFRDIMSVLKTSGGNADIDHSVVDFVLPTYACSCRDDEIARLLLKKNERIFSMWGHASPIMKKALLSRMPDTYRVNPFKKT